MRAIDADKMKADLLTVDPRFEPMIYWCISVLDAQPTINPEPCEYAVSAIAVEEMLKDLLPERGMWEIEGDEAKTAICETVKDALDGLWKLPFNSKEMSSTHKALDSDIEERKTGKWIISNANSRVTTYKCSECGRIVRDDTGYDVSKDYPYCHCGSDMRGEQK